MNLHCYSEALRQCLLEAKPGLAVHTAVSSAALSTPYVLLVCTAEEELVRGNGTWECALAAQLHTSGYDEADATSRRMFTELCSFADSEEARQALNARKPGFYVYAQSLQSIEEPQAQEQDFIQNARFRVILQF